MIELDPVTTVRFFLKETPAKNRITVTAISAGAPARRRGSGTVEMNYHQAEIMLGKGLAEYLAQAALALEIEAAKADQGEDK